jgi:hypothetical protein
MRKPNLFIIGAPKCGTTSLAYWLSQHPEIYMSANKEPHFFSTDIYLQNRISFYDYLKLFESASNKQKWLGEASARYLYSKKAVPSILGFTEKQKFIAIVRNPVDMVYSLHNHLIYLGSECIKNFKEAWRACEARKKGYLICKKCQDPNSLIYNEVAMLGEQIERFFEIVPARDRLVIIFDDLKERPAIVLKEIFNFLLIQRDININMGVKNRSMARRSELLNHCIRMAANIKQYAGIDKGLGILNYIVSINRIEKERPPLPQDLKNELKDYFKEDVEKLSSILGKNLQHWCEY